MARDTSTGYVHEQMVRAALEAGGYTIAEQSQVGTRPNGRRRNWTDKLLRNPLAP